jgi:hypothetical protein
MLKRLVAGYVHRPWLLMVPGMAILTASGLFPVSAVVQVLAVVLLVPLAIILLASQDNSVICVWADCPRHSYAGYEHRTGYPNNEPLVIGHGYRAARVEPGERWAEGGYWSDAPLVIPGRHTLRLDNGDGSTQIVTCTAEEQANCPPGSTYPSGIFVQHIRRVDN